ncbi:DUF2382 domain-containing protein [Segetibacter sp. 3557_3]|nr:DUF2382 domain-containing protein [Segetibacter sp. 3557_3]
MNFKDNDFDIDKDTDRKVLVPIGIARLHEKDDDVVLPGVTIAQLQSLPEYDEDNLTADNEHNIRNVFAGVGGAALAGAGLTHGGNDDRSESHSHETFYDHDHFNEDNLLKNRTGSGESSQTIPVIQEELQVGKREVETGRVRLRSRIVEDQVQEDVQLREEKVRVVTTPVDRPANSADIKEESIELTERSEVPVVEKEARVVEEVSLDKEVTEREKTITDTVRNTEVDIEKTDGEDTTRDNRL